MYIQRTSYRPVERRVEFSRLARGDVGLEIDSSVSQVPRSQLYRRTLRSVRSKLGRQAWQVDQIMAYMYSMSTAVTARSPAESAITTICTPVRTI